MINKCKLLIAGLALAIPMAQAAYASNAPQPQAFSMYNSDTSFIIAKGKKPSKKPIKKSTPIKKCPDGNFPCTKGKNQTPSCDCPPIGG
jgi:hypothetical protein